MRLVILQNADFEGPGFLLDWARDAGFTPEVSPAYAGVLPAAATHVIVLGGPESVHDLPRLSWLAREAEWLRAVLAGDARVLGICLGAQLVAHVLGGEVLPGPHAEIGWHPFEWAGRSFPLFQWHREVFTLPPGAVPIARSPATPLQGFACGRAWAIAGHPEVTPALASTFIARCWSAPEGDARYVQLPGEMEAHGPVRFAEGRDGVRALLDAWAFP